jgi:hypothetical protein
MILTSRRSRNSADVEFQKTEQTITGHQGGSNAGIGSPPHRGGDEAHRFFTAA